MGHESTKVAIIPNSQVPLIGFQKFLFLGNWDDFLKPRMWNSFVFTPEKNTVFLY